MNEHISGLRQARKRQSRRGDSLLEVMAALVILSIGVVGVSSTQIAAERSGRDSTETANAVSFARVWLDRVKRDALAWRAPGNPNPADIVVGRAPVPISTYFVPSPFNADVWTVPVPLHGAESAGADARGLDVGTVVDSTVTPVRRVLNRDIYYCLNLKFTVEALDQLGQTDMMRVTARVWWPRNATPGTASYMPLLAVRGADGCAGHIPSSAELTNVAYRVIYEHAFITWTATQQ